MSVNTIRRTEQRLHVHTYTFVSGFSSDFIQDHGGKDKHVSSYEYGMDERLNPSIPKAANRLFKPSDDLTLRANAASATILWSCC